MGSKKIAVFHNCMDNIGGAEIVCLILARELNADLYTTNIDEDKIKKMGFSGINIRSIGRIPANPPFRQQAALAKFQRLNLGSDYAFYIIGGDWAVSGAVNNKPNLWYVHAPMREIWDLYEYTRQTMVPPLFRIAFDFWIRHNRKLVRGFVKDVQGMACNSRNTQRRIKNYLSRDTAIVNPPVDTAGFRCGGIGDYWLSVSRLIYHKRVDIQMEAFTRLPEERLIIVGSYEKAGHFKKCADHLKRIKPSNVEIRSWISREELIGLYAGCKGFITTSRDEDFGMTPVEAMASGKPVIAPDEGGCKETVVNNVTGLLIDNINADKLAAAILKISEEPLKYKNACLERAKKFSTEVFIGKIKKMIEE
ncbi:MAG: glycosyltransferase [Candidatus Omnitrophica bacterium]|nr:glycosyltransferase [Candidatus Omnitrophota bacterium]